MYIKSNSPQYPHPHPILVTMVIIHMESGQLRCSLKDTLSQMLHLARLRLQLFE